jgi:UDPglucose 6-dehydrogenase
MAKVGIFGAGWVGLVTGSCFAELGHEVVIRDVVPAKVEALRRGEVPFHEEQVPELLAKNADRLTFTLDVADVADCEYLFVCVDTPPTYSGDADLSRVWTVVDELPELEGRPILVMKSTVPVGTGEKVRVGLDQRGLDHVGYASNPEFLAEGRAVADFMSPDRIVVGAFAAEDAEAVAGLYAGIDAPVVRTDVNSAEMIKLAANAFLMTRISFINEIANVCEATGADVVAVANGVGLDSRLGPHFLRAGIGYGGSCLAGEETVLVRGTDGVRLVGLSQLYAGLDDGEAVDVLSWRRDSDTAEFWPVSQVTRREYDGDLLEVKTKMGRRLRCTPDHPFVTRDGVKLAQDLTTDDWLPIALGAPAGSEMPALDVLEGLDAAGLTRSDVLVAPGPASDASQPFTRGLRLDAAEDVGIAVAQAVVRSAPSANPVPTRVTADSDFWRVVGLYIAEGHAAATGTWPRIFWSFHPSKDIDLIADVVAFWRSRRVHVGVRKAATATHVFVSSRILAGWWLQSLGLGRNSYEQRLPDAIWSAPDEDKWALLSGLWRGDGSWSFVNGGPSVILEYGTVSRELADGILRLLSGFGVVASMRVGRTSKSTCDTYWIRISGAAQVEQLLDFVPEWDRPAIRASIARQAKRIAPTGYRRGRNAAWVRVAVVSRAPFSGAVYSLEVPGTHTFVTTGGLICDNCFPKDSLALKQLASNSGYHFQLLSAVIEVNELQKRRVIGKLKRHLGQLRGKTIALLGLAFKPNTDDMREAPSIVLASRLLAEGADVRAWDPVVRGDDKLPRGVEIVDTVLDAVRGADAAVIVTEWGELKALASPEVRKAMANPLIVDGRNLLDPEQTRAAGFTYEGIGRAAPPSGVAPQPAQQQTRA